MESPRKTGITQQSSLAKECFRKAFRGRYARRSPGIITVSSRNGRKKTVMTYRLPETENPSEPDALFLTVSG